MIAFLVLATALVLVTLAVLLRSVLGARSQPGMANALRAENIAIAREQLAALDASKGSGALNAADYAEERLRIEATLSRELEHDGNERDSRGANLALGAIIVLGVPLGAAWLYWQIGSPAAMIAPPALASNAASDTGAGEGSAGTGEPANGSGAPALDELVPRLEQRLSEQPDDVIGWRLLGRTFIGMQQFERALAPLQRAIELEPADAGTHAQLAEARAMLADGDLNGAALEPLERAHALDPQHEQALWLLAVARQQADRHAEASELLSTLRALADAAGNAQAVVTIDEYLARSRAALGLETPASPSPPALDEQPDAPLGGAATASGGASDGVSAATLDVAVSLGDAAKSATGPDLAVFIYARAADGPPIPLAVQRLTVADLPITVTLDESMAMLPNMTLAAFTDVVVGARVSLSGQPTPTSGDWSVERRATVGEDGTGNRPLALMIEQPLP